MEAALPRPVGMEMLGEEPEPEPRPVGRAIPEPAAVGREKLGMEKLERDSAVRPLSWALRLKGAVPVGGGGGAVPVPGGWWWW